jgi:hypothetical protein
MHKISLTMHNLKIQERRRKVSSLLAQSMTGSEISEELKVDQAKSDLSYYYKQCIDGIEEVRRKGWDIFKKHNALTPRDKLLALKVIRECNEAKFALFKEGPSIMHIKSLEETLENH